MSPDRLWSVLWGERLLLPAQMWRELNMNIWSRKPHTGMNAHAMTYILTHSFYLERTQPWFQRDWEKAILLCWAPSHLFLWEQQIWNPGMAHCSLLSTCSPHTCISHTSSVPVELNSKTWHGCGKSWGEGSGRIGLGKVEKLAQWRGWIGQSIGNM